MLKKSKPAEGVLRSISRDSSLRAERAKSILKSIQVDMVEESSRKT